MKYFNPSYWFKLWVLSAPLFNSENQGINAKSIDNKKIKDWVSNNTSLESINEYNNLTNSSTNYQPYNLNQVSNQNINPIYQTELETSTHKHRHEKSRNKRENNYLKWTNSEINTENVSFEEFQNLIIPAIAKSDYSNWFGKVKIIKKLPKNSKDGNLKAGDMYVATNKGIFSFYIKKNEIKHYQELHKQNIIDIQFIINSADVEAYVINENNEIYYFKGWNPEKLENAESSNLNKELKIFYSYDKKNLTRYLTPKINYYNNNQYISLNLGKIHPLNYQKIEFLGDTGKYDSTCTVKWGDYIYNSKVSSHCFASDCFITDIWRYFADNHLIRRNFFHHIIEEKKNSISDSNTIILMKGEDKFRSAKIRYDQRLGLTWYKENKNYYLQIHTLQYCEWWASYSSLDCSMKIGNGIRLYNDEQYILLTSEEKQKIFNKLKNEIREEIKANKEAREKWIKENQQKEEIKKLKELEIEKRKSDGDLISRFIKFACTSYHSSPDASKGIINTFTECINLPDDIELVAVGTGTLGTDENYLSSQNILKRVIGNGNIIESGIGFGFVKGFAKKRREISNINNLEEKNVTKWTNEFTKSINHEQHLPITNNANFVTNNITSL